MKRVLMATAGAFALAIAAQTALAADIPAKAPAYKAPVAAPVFNWSGFYVGLNAGYGWSDTNWTYPLANFFGPAGTNFGLSPDGWLAGVHLGYNWQTAPNYVFGFDVSWDWSGLRDEVTGPVAVFPNDEHTAKIRNLGLVTARAGVIANAALWYVKGGYATGAVLLSSLSGTPVPNVTWDDSRRLHGWTLGAGVEVAWWGPNTTFGIEYNYVNLSGKNFSGLTGGAAPGIPISVNLGDVDIHTVLARVSYRFATGKAPVKANY